MEKNNEVKDEKLEKVSGGMYYTVTDVADPNGNGDEEPKVIITELAH